MSNQNLNQLWTSPNLNYFSIYNLQLFKYFTKSSALNSDFLIYQNIFYPIIFIFIANFVLVEFYKIKNFKNIKEYLALIFSSLLLGFFAFNQKENNLFSNSFAVLTFFYTVSFFMNKNSEIENRQYGEIFNLIIANLVFLNSQFIVLSAIFYILCILYVFMKKINFGLNLVSQSSIFFIFSLSVFFISKYSSYYDAGFAVIFSLLLAASVILFSILYISKKNYVKSYWVVTQKITFSLSKYFKFIYLFSFLIFTVLVLFSAFKDLTNDHDFSITFSRINLYNFLINVLNFNSNLQSFDYLNKIFFIFYLVLFFVSFFYVLMKFKKINESKSNLLFFMFAVFLIFNPFVIFEIKYLSNFLTLNNNYDFLLYYDFIILFTFIFVVNSFKEIKITKITHKLDNNNNFKQIKSVKSFLKACHYQYLNLFQNCYFQLSINGFLMLFFTFSIFICNL